MTIQKNNKKYPEIFMQQRRLIIDHRLFLLKYYICNGCSFVVKVWQEYQYDSINIVHDSRTNIEDVNSENKTSDKPEIIFYLRFVGDVVHNTSALFETFCEKEDMLRLFKLYEYLANSVPWDLSNPLDGTLYCKKEYNFDVSGICNN